MKINNNCQNLIECRIHRYVVHTSVQCSSRWTRPSQSKARARMNEPSRAVAVSTASEAAGGYGTATWHRHTVAKNCDWEANPTETTYTHKPFSRLITTRNWRANFIMILILEVQGKWLLKCPITITVKGRNKSALVHRHLPKIRWDDYLETASGWVMASKRLCKYGLA